MLAQILETHQHEFAAVLPVDLNAPDVARLDFTAANPLLQNANLRDTAAFEELVSQLLAAQHAHIGVGGYLENRVIYRRSGLFGAPDPAVPSRSLHLGVDVWLRAGTPVLAPLDAVVHSVQDNDNFGDYGPTVILEHQLEDTTFYTLYGHLTRRETLLLRPGMAIEKGEVFTEVGPAPENGDWPPHLHFQVISDMLGLTGDFPGVALPAERDKWAALCPDPNLILQSQWL
ncbi:peptidoglycan DD-metalloendopeptidase family protein [Hymenobacter taeanensis]|uniref:Peptidoglycan DD-metalloendopeptidase family protein n=1 Tax=Hymenobacter taeanensis TaxID=2735321 RepID=A0A6M6BMA3_9BACT|nr:MULTISPECIES: peptidoglycan DD-metalloendopeptidase family protein [Hymenobacter]QJX49107.1 peptidoglycan DD-metalloendopeptidase family protein [Hymenobacter taeanensis]UOQ81369.1 peptidoglycan DD-metalloendopeptidase family protein [Hymenobacter sp. 5414T-23]